MKYFPVVIIIIFIVGGTTSCSVKNLQYIQGSFDTARLSKVEIPEPVIQKGDMLGISVYSDDPQATAAVTNPFANTGSSLSNSGGSSGGGGAVTSGASSQQGFLVTQAGEIQLYKLGAIQVEGKTKKQLGDTLAKMYADQGFLKNPFVEVRFMSYKVTVIGEVGHAGSFSVPTDKLNVFEAISLAGDISMYGRRDNVLIVREANGQRTFGRLDLRDPNVFLSPFYYLQQNDLLVVDVSKNKAMVNNQSKFQLITIVSSLISITAVFLTLFRR